MNPRIAMKEVLKFVLRNLEFDHEKAAELAEQMHNDPNFLEALEEFVGEHLDYFGENYGLE